MNKRYHAVRRPSVVVGLILLLALAAACGGKTEKSASVVADLAMPVATITAGQGTSAGEFIVSGSLQPLNHTTISTEVGGTVRTVNVEVGDRVRRGQTLAQLDLSDFTLGVQQAEAARDAAAIAFETAEKNYQRFVSLHKDGSASPADLDQATLGFKGAKANLEQATAMCGLARNRLSKATVRAPYDGQVTQRLVSVGAYVDAMMHPVMFVMVDNSKLRAMLDLPEMRAALLAPGDAVRLALPSLQREITAQITVITDSVDPMSHTRTAVATIANAGPNPLPSGIYFEAHIVPAALRGKIMLPAAAVRTEAGGRYSAYVAQSGKAVQKAITGKFLADNSEFIVENGIETGEKVVVESTMVRNGQPLAIAEEAPAAADATAPAAKPADAKPAAPTAKMKTAPAANLAQKESGK
jgi:multidrug efflux system membrane fusion protein